MTWRQERFVRAYNMHGNAAKAARQAGYSPNGVNRMGYYLKRRLRYEIAYFKGDAKDRRAVIRRVLDEFKRAMDEYERGGS